MSFISAGFFSDFVGKITGQAIAKEDCEIIRRAPTRDKYWEGLGLNTSAHPEITKYRIRWFMGRWSEWFITGINDTDWKDNCGDKYFLGGRTWDPNRPDNCSRRVWSYFTDHTHEYELCPSEIPTNETNTAFCFDTDGGINYYVKGIIEYRNLATGEVQEREDECYDEYTIREYYCHLVPAGPSNAVILDFCPEGCQNGACIGDPPSNETEPINETDPINNTPINNSFCNDTDGYNLYVKGTRTSEMGTHDDFCKPSMAMTAPNVLEGPYLNELFCSGHLLNASRVLCDFGCFDGACFSSNETGNTSGTTYLGETHTVGLSSGPSESEPEELNFFQRIFRIFRRA